MGRVMDILSLNLPLFPLSNQLAMTPVHTLTAYPNSNSCTTPLSSSHILENFIHFCFIVTHSCVSVCIQQ
jgi:hypothetical protein